MGKLYKVLFYMGFTLVSQELDLRKGGVLSRNIRWYRPDYYSGQTSISRIAHSASFSFLVLRFLVFTISWKPSLLSSRLSSPW
jgi:hypothetical protein